MKWRRLRRALFELVHAATDRKIGDENGAEAKELRRLADLPPKTETTTSLLNNFSTNDGRALAGMYKHVFMEKSLTFRCNSVVPRIVDCGANVGVTVRFWKDLFEGCRVSAFEADPRVFEFLRRNCGHLEGVTIFNNAVWINDDILDFISNDSIGGHLASLSGRGERVNTYRVSGVRLRDLLSEKVDMLKMDIEGAEVPVILDCADLLTNVDRMFLEYHSFVDQKQELSSLIGVLERAGFRVHAHSEMPAAHPFIECPIVNGKDFRLNIFASRNGL